MNQIRKKHTRIYGEEDVWFGPKILVMVFTLHDWGIHQNLWKHIKLKKNAGGGLYGG